MRFMTYNRSKGICCRPACEMCWEGIMSVSSCTEPSSGWTWRRSSKDRSSKAAQPITRRCC